MSVNQGAYYVDTLEWLETAEGAPQLREPVRLELNPGPVNPATGASHTYTISGMDLSTNPEAPENSVNELVIYFQNGVTPEVGLNGVTPEILLEMLIHRFEGFQSGPFACDENQEALEHFQGAAAAIRKRMADRTKRGVANTYER